MSRGASQRATGTPEAWADREERRSRVPGRGSSGYRVRVLALLLVAASVGMSNFGAAIAIGVSGVDARTRLRVGLIFGVFESGMPVVGLIIGEQVGGPLGHAARW